MLGLDFLQVRDVLVVFGALPFDVGPDRVGFVLVAAERELIQDRIGNAWWNRALTTYLSLWLFWGASGFHGVLAHPRALGISDGSYACLCMQTLSTLGSRACLVVDCDPAGLFAGGVAFPDEDPADVHGRSHFGVPVLFDPGTEAAGFWLGEVCSGANAFATEGLEEFLPLASGEVEFVCGFGSGVDCGAGVDAAGVGERRLASERWARGAVRF